MVTFGFVLVGVNVVILTIGGVLIGKELMERHEMNRIRKETEKEYLMKYGKI